MISEDKKRDLVKTAMLLENARAAADPIFNKIFESMIALGKERLDKNAIAGDKVSDETWNDIILFFASQKVLEISSVVNKVVESKLAEYLRETREQLKKEFSSLHDDKKKKEV